TMRARCCSTVAPNGGACSTRSRWPACSRSTGPAVASAPPCSGPCSAWRSGRAYGWTGEAPVIHIVHVLHSLGVGGTENGVVNLINALGGEFRHSVVSMTTRGVLAERLAGAVEVYPLGKRAGLDLVATARLAGALRRLRPDIVHSRNWGALDALPAARLAGVPVLIHGEHGWEASDPGGPSRRRNRLRRLLSPLVWRFTTVSRDLERWLTTTVGI